LCRIGTPRVHKIGRRSCRERREMWLLF
jgi:hypothetical protein